ASMSRVKPALFTRMSSEPSAPSTCSTRAAGAAGSARSAGATSTPSPRSAASASSSAAPAALVEQVEGALGSLDILVNNAGFTRDMLALRMGDADWAAVLEVDLTAPFRLARAGLRGMMKRRWGRIVSIASIVGVTGNAGQANYAAAKAGLIGMSKSLAQEVATRGVTVNVVAPGFVKTAMTDALNEAQKAKLMERIPTGRMGAPEDIAAAVVFLASVEAGWTTGQTLHVNGGMAMI
ncbi:MAG: SDR family oxidoreductase, partial [Acetobacteraceae bacterium]